MRTLLDHRVGIIIIFEQAEPSVYQSLLLVFGMLVLAPICEEIFFRGMVQIAYEGRSKRSGFVIAAVFIGGALGIATREIIPGWLHLVALAGCGLAVVLFGSLPYI